MQEIDHFIGPGELIGEQIYRLCYQNPKLGFFFLRLIVERLLRDVKRGAIKPGTV